MRATPRTVADGLWRCLSPSIDATLSAKHRPSTRPSISANALHRRRPWLCQTRPAHAGPPTAQVSSSRLDAKDVMKPSQSPIPHHLSNKALYNVLLRLRGPRLHDDQSQRIEMIVRFLIEERGEKPNIFLYEALVVANWDCHYGSAEALERIWGEMLEADIPPSQSFLHAALKLLANHPNFVLRQAMLNEIQDRGFELSDEGKCSVALGLLRETQYELALDHFHAMLRHQTAIPLWVFDIFILELGKHAFLEEAIELMRLRPSLPDRPSIHPGDLWYFLLDRSSFHLRYRDTKLLWDLTVARNLVTPSDGQLTNVLNTAARHGDAALALDAVQRLSARLPKLALHHYEALIDCYVYAGDAASAFNVLFIMAGAGVPPETASTRTLYALLQRSPAALAAALDTLLAGAEGQGVPAPALDLALEILCEQGEVDRAVDVYARVAPLLLAPGPGLRTFELLLERPAAVAAETTEQLLAEARFYGVGTADVYDRLVAKAAGGGDVARCFELLGLMEAVPLGKGYAQKPWLSKRTLLVLLRRLFADRDPRAWDLVERAEARGMVVEEEVEAMLVPSSDAGGAEEGVR